MIGKRRKKNVFVTDEEKRKAANKVKRKVKSRQSEQQQQQIFKNKSNYASVGLLGEQKAHSHTHICDVCFARIEIYDRFDVDKLQLIDIRYRLDVLFERHSKSKL